MLVIRTAQLQTLEDDAARIFEQSMVDHAREFAARHCSLLGDDGVRGVVRFASQKAEQFGLTYCGPRRLCLELVFMFGAAFDTDPLLPWASAILADRDIDSQMIRAERLYNASNEYIERVAGPHNVYALNALRALGAMRENEGRSLTPARLLEELRAAYPQKCAYAGDTALNAMLEHAAEVAKAHRLDSDEAHVLFGVLSFIAGRGFADDPCLPWVGRTLHDPRLADPARRVARLKSRCLTYADHVLGNLGLA